MSQSTQVVGNNGNSGDQFLVADGATTALLYVNTGMVLQSILCPADLTATHVSLVEMSPDYEPVSGVGTWYQVYNSGDATTAGVGYEFDVGASRCVRFNPADFYTGVWFRLTFNAAQTGDTYLKAVLGVVTGN